jgi:hypothetical protein
VPARGQRYSIIVLLQNTRSLSPPPAALQSYIITSYYFPNDLGLRLKNSTESSATRVLSFTP